MSILPQSYLASLFLKKKKKKGLTQQQLLKQQLQQLLQLQIDHIQIDENII